MWGLLHSALVCANALVPAWLGSSEVGFQGHHGGQKHHKAPHAPYADGGAWADAFELAKNAVLNMTVEEKVNITSAILGPCPSNTGGVPRLNITGMCFDDGPAGPRYTDFVTQFPSAFFAAASFDRDLMYERAARIGNEFRGKGINVALAPVTGGPLGRSPYAGRNWEAFSPDPYLSATMSGITVRGMQSSGLITCAKHYVLYEQEPVCTGPLDWTGGRTDCLDVSSNVDDKTFKELYLPSFVESVRAGTGAVMCSYNLINGTFSCENDYTMNTILKGELNFQGFILSDYGATHSTVPTAMAGMDMELPSVAYFGPHLLEAVKHGHVPVHRLDDMVRRILTPWYAFQQNRSYPETNFQKWTLEDEIEIDGRKFRNAHADNRGDNPSFARKIAAESTVLLKNTGVLPLRNIRRIGVFGSDADYPHTLSGCGPDLFCMTASKERYWNGTVTIGGGSGAAYADYVAAPLEAITLRARAQGIRVDHLLHDDPAHFVSMGFIASQSEVCLVFVSVFLKENQDRDPGLRLDKGGEDLIRAVEARCAGEVVVIMHVGGQVVVEDWVHLPRIGGVIFAGYPGQETGNALVDILWGDVNPSGKLPFTMGKATSDWPTGNILRETSRGWLETNPRSVFSEGLAIDYKWFDKYDITPRYEFGFGLSYTTFEMASLKVEKGWIKAADTVQATNEKHEGGDGLYDTIYVARVNVTNTGSTAGAEVAQLYMSYPQSEVEQPPRHLKGFDKVYLQPGQTQTVEMHLRKKDISVWDVKHQTWRIPKGRFVFYAGNSSRNLPLEFKLDIKDKQ